MKAPPRPKRRHIPQRIKRLVCERQGWVCKCGCGTPVYTHARGNTVFDHEPALRLRDVNRDRTDYIPPQHSPQHIDAYAEGHDRKKTFGMGTVAGSDFGKIKKERKGARPPKRKRPWPKRKMQSRPFRA